MIDTTADGWPSMRLGGDWATEYRHVRRLLFGALARLASDGYAVPPSEGLDLVHDFLLEAWDGLSRHYDPAKGGRDTYVYASFVRFARPRIGRLRRLRANLAAPAEVAKMLGGASPAEAERRRTEAVSAWSVLEGQPSPHRDLLLAYLSEDRPTERRLATDFNMTRYEMRLRLADAVGRAALALSGTADFPEKDRAVALALWRDDRTPKEAAALLGTSVGRINEARHRVFARLAAASKPVPSRRRKTMTTPVRKSKIADLLVAALRPGATRSEVAALADHREAILNLLEDERVGDLPLKAMPDDEQLAQVYVALAGVTPDEADDPFRASRDGDDTFIGECFAEVLLPNLSDRLRAVEPWFDGVALMSAEDVAALREDPSVIAGGEAARRLANYGITPVAVAVAGQALAAFAARTAEAAGVDIEGKVVWEVAEVGARPKQGEALLQRARAIREIGLAAELPDDAAAGLHGWIAAAAAYTPRLLDGFEATSQGSGTIVLTRTDRFTSDLRQLWKGPDQGGGWVAPIAR